MAALPTKEADLSREERKMFQQVVTCYEKKEYTRGIKLAETILKKHPSHGETQAMKGLLKNCQGAKEEAYELVKLGLRNNMRSHVCWHVYGLLYRSDNNYKEASKCYLNALRWYSDNQNILRDLGWLQIHLRDYSGFVTTREKILKSRPGLRTSWVGAAMANSMAGNFSKAFELVTKSNDALAGEAPLSAYEQSELLLFQNQCLEKDGKYDAALGHLEEIAGNVVDALSIRVKTAQLLLLTGKFPEAQEAWLKLVKEQSENYRFHSGLQAAHLGLDASLSKEMLSLKQLDMPCTVLTLTSEQQASLLALYRSGQFKSSKKIEIFLVGLGTEFRAMLDEHMRRCLREGVPALYHDVCTLVKQPDPSRPEALLLVKDPVDFAGHPVTSVVRDILSGFIWNLREKGSFDAAPAADAKPEPPTALLWAMFLEVHLLERSGELARALSLIDECVHHTPTAPDMQLKRGRLLKLCGDYSGAASAVDEGRALDLQDRYLNNKSTKYLLRADRIDDAVATISLFTKHEGDPQKYLADMQCSWFEVEAGDAHSRAKNWGQALKKYASVQEHFKDYVEDMFDFHGFCIRKTSLRAHAEAVAMQDDVFAHKFFQRAFRGAARVYLHLLDEPEDIDGLGHLSKEERKKEKARRKKKRDRDVKAQEASDKAVAEEAKWSGKAAPAQTKDTDPLGERLVTSVDGKSRNFAEDAQAWCAFLAPRLASSEPDTLALYTEIQLRRGKVVPAVKALAAGWRKSANCPALHVALVRTAQRVSGLSSGGGAGSNLASKDSVKQAVTPALSALLGGLSLPAFVAEYVQQAQKGSGLVASLPHRVSACRCLLALHGCKIGGNSVGESKERAAAREEAGKVLDGEELWAERGISVANAIDAYKFIVSELLASTGSAALSALRGRFLSSLKGAFPLAQQQRIDGGVVEGEGAEAGQVCDAALEDMA